MRTLKTNLIIGINRLPDAVKREGHFVRPLSVYLKLGGVVGMGWTYRDLRKDWYTYSGTNLAIALGTDVLPTLFSAIGGFAATESGPASIKIIINTVVRT